MKSTKYILYCLFVTWANQGASTASRDQLPAETWTSLEPCITSEAETGLRCPGAVDKSGCLSDQHFVQMTLFGKGDTFMLYNSTGTLSLFQAIGIIRCFINKLGYIQLEHFIWDYKRWFVEMRWRRCVGWFKLKQSDWQTNIGQTQMADGEETYQTKRRKESARLKCRLGHYCYYVV